MNSIPPVAHSSRPLSLLARDASSCPREESVQVRFIHSEGRARTCSRCRHDLKRGARGALRGNQFAELACEDHESGRRSLAR